MKTFLKSLASKITVFDALNKSDESHKALAREKLLLHIFFVLCIDTVLLVVAPIKFWYLVWPMVIVVTQNGMVRYLFDWKYFFKTKSFKGGKHGYILCPREGDGCGRFKPYKDANHGDVEGLDRTVCAKCAPKAIANLREKDRQKEESQKRLSDARSNLDHIKKALEQRDEVIAKLREENAELKERLKG